MKKKSHNCCEIGFQDGFQVIKCRDCRFKKYKKVLAKKIQQAKMKKIKSKKKPMIAPKINKKILKEDQKMLQEDKKYRDNLQKQIEQATKTKSRIRRAGYNNAHQLIYDKAFRGSKFKK